MKLAWELGVNRPSCAPLDGDLVTDACVVGLGATGLAACEALAMRGLDVVGVDAGVLAGGAAGRNGGFLLGGPALFLHDALQAWGTPAVELYRETLAELATLSDRIGHVVRPVGSLRLAGLPGHPRDDVEAADRERETADLAAHAAALRIHGIAVQEYDGQLGHALYLPDDAATNPVARAVAVAAQLPPSVTLYEHTPAVEVAPHRVFTGRGTVTAQYVLVAVDGRLEIMLPQLGERVRTARLQMLCTSPVAPIPGLPVPTCPVYGRWGYDYAQQLPDGRLFVGGGRDLFADQEWTIETSTTPQVQAWIEQVACRVAGGPVTVTHRWAASVGFTEDGRPLCTAIDRDVVAVGGYNGTGNLVGPVAARAGVALLLDGTPPPAWAAT